MKMSVVRQTARAVGGRLVLAGLVFYLAHFGWATVEHPVEANWGILAALVVLVATLGGHAKQRARRLTTAVRLLFGLSFVVLILLSSSLVEGAILAAAYAGVLIVLSLDPSENRNLAVGGLLQLIGLWAVFLGGAVWHWPAIVFLLLTYAVSYMSALWLLDPYEERSRSLMATSWGLIACEIGYVFSLWLVNYIIHGGWVILPQAALVTTALGYVFVSIYLAHKQAKLGVWRLAEYLLIGLLLIVIVVVGTKWSGAI